jgi:hypothetical protein
LGNGNQNNQIWYEIPVFGFIASAIPEGMIEVILPAGHRLRSVTCSLRAAVLSIDTGFQTVFHKPNSWLAIIPFLIGGLHAQTTLALSPAAEGASLELALNSTSGVIPAAIQWIIQYPAAAIQSITVEDGPALTSAGKTVICAGDAGVFNCMVVGFNGELIPDGVIARVTVRLAADESAAAITITDALGVSAAGHPIPIDAKSGSVTRAPMNRILSRQRAGGK